MMDRKENILKQQTYYELLNIRNELKTNAYKYDEKTYSNRRESFYELSKNVENDPKYKDDIKEWKKEISTKDFGKTQYEQAAEKMSKQAKSAQEQNMHYETSQYVAGLKK